MIIKKWNSVQSQWDEQYPKTIHTELYDANNVTTKLFDDQNKLKKAYLPDAVFGGMALVGSISTTSTPPAALELNTLIDGTITSGYAATQLDTYTNLTYTNGDYASIGQRYIGLYWIVASSLGSVVIADSSTSDEAEWGAAVYDDGQLPIVEQSGQTNKLNLENGDWLVITGWDNANSRFKFSVINNSYQAATTSNKGVVELATDAEVTTGTATNLIPSVKQLKDNYAPVSHQHDETNIDMANAYSNIGTGVGDTLEDVLLAVNTVLGTQASNITTNANDIASLEGRKELFVQALAPTANQANDIWFDI